MAKYIILIETTEGRFYEEAFEDMSAKSIREKIGEIYLDGFVHESPDGTVVKIKPDSLKVVKSERI